MRTLSPVTFCTSVLLVSTLALAAPNPPNAITEALGVRKAHLSPRHDHEDHTNHSHYESLSSPLATDHELIVNISTSPKKGLGHVHGEALSPSAHGGHQHFHGPAIKEFSESVVLLTHAPDPATAYWRQDWQTERGHPALLVTHVTLMSVGFFVFLPLTIFLKSGGSAFAMIAQVAFLITSILGLLSGRAYSSLSGDLYEKDAHSRLGWAIMIVAIGINVVDVARSVTRLISTGRMSKQREVELEEQLLHDGVVSEDRQPVDSDEEHYILSSPTEIPSSDLHSNWADVELHTNAHSERTNPSRRSYHSSDADGTLYDAGGSGEFDVDLLSQSRWIRRVAAASMLANGVLAVLGYVQTLSGIAVYSGSCRGAYINGCLAHTIKGSIFIFYGLITWGRYLGAFSHLGWAWNKRPHGSRAPSAEMVESAVCFVYGATNTWLERLGKRSGDAWSAKDVQHVSIAVMFWFAGLLGVLLESKIVRSWLSTPVLHASGVDRARVAHPASASFSFNPFPGIIIGTTGIAMAAHAQQFQFQVEVHTLWGLLLALFAVFRFLTYFFLYLRPPHSVLPGRPPTEALASLCLTCGGVVFVLSTEQVTFAAMRHGFADLMLFLNFAVSLVSVVFCFILALFAVQGWSLSRSASRFIRSGGLEKP